MSIYIVRSKTISTMRSVQLASIRLTADSRSAQIDEVFNIRMEDSTDRKIRDWVSDSGVKRITTAERSTPVTGTTLLDMTDEEAEKMRKELPNAMVLRDQPMELIRPLRPVASAVKKKVTKKDLWHLKAIGLESARLNGFKGTGKGVTVAVLDTGVDETHPELKNKVLGAYTFDVNAWQASPITPSIDTDGHGTHVSGLICGNNTGVAPEAKVLSGIMIPKGFGNLSDFILALEWAAERPEVQIVNMSAGIVGYLPEMREAIADLIAIGILPVIAVGNEGRNITRSPGNYIEVLSVGASDIRNKVSSFSGSGTIIADNHQYIVPDLVAPGKNVYSSVMGGSYEAWDGTSMATPIVSGVASLILEKHPRITVMDLQDAIFSTCKKLIQTAGRQGYGLIQVKAAL